MSEFLKEIRAIVSDRLDLTRDLSDDDIREVISNIIAEKSQEKYLTLTEKKAVMDGVFNSMRGLDPSCLTIYIYYTIQYNKIKLILTKKRCGINHSVF